MKKRKKRIIALLLIFSMSFSFININPFNSKKVYATGIVEGFTQGQYVLYYILASLGISIPFLGSEDDIAFQAMKAEFERQDVINTLVTEGVKGGVCYITDEIKQAFNDTVDYLLANDVYTASALLELDELAVSGGFPASYSKMLTWSHYTSCPYWIGLSYSSGTKWAIIFSETPFKIIANVDGTATINSSYTYRYLCNKVTSDFYFDGGTIAGFANATILANNANDVTIDYSGVLAAAHPGSTVFPDTSDDVVELTLPTIFPTGITQDDLAGKNVTEFPVSVGVASYPYGSDDDVDSTAFPWYYPLTKWFKKVATNVGDIGNTISGSITAAKDSIISAIKEATGTNVGTDSSGKEHDWPQLPQLLNLLILILILIIRLVIACLGMVTRLGSIGASTTYLNEDFIAGLDFLKNHEVLPELTYFNAIVGIATIVQVCALVKFIRKKISFEVS